ncbi:MAG TPA: hypothetical protein VLZ82_00550 [Microbacterium sp.]|nr:hypothetical protein [Microbacterium sp.]
MSGIGDQGIMPEHVLPQTPDDESDVGEVEDPDAAAASHDRNPDDRDGTPDDRTPDDGGDRHDG